MEKIRKMIADGLNKLGWLPPDIPDENGEMKFGPNCHEVITITEELEKLIEAAPVVYGTNDGLSYWDNIRFGTHKARLMFIEELEKEPCKHVPMFFADGEPSNFFKCKHCGIELVAEWKPKDKDKFCEISGVKLDNSFSE